MRSISGLTTLINPVVRSRWAGRLKIGSARNSRNFRLRQELGLVQVGTHQVARQLGRKLWVEDMLVNLVR